MTDDDPITLAHAAEQFGLGVWTLRAEADRGRLTIYKIGKRLYTTPNSVRAMVRECLVEPKAPASIATRRAVSSASETARASLDSAQQALMRLKGSSRNTSQRSIARTAERRS